MDLHKIKAVIFDMDGLMLNTEKIAWDIFYAGCRTWGFIPDQFVFNRTIGTDGPTTWSILKEGYGRSFPAQKVKAYFQHHYLLKIKSTPIPVKKGLFSLLHLFTRLNLKLAVGTTTRREMAYLKLKHTDLLRFFPVIITGDDVERRKPFPDIFKKAARKLTVAEENCLVLEDSDNGVRAALTANIMVIQIPDLKEPSREIRECGHLILDSLQQVESLFKSLVPGETA